MNFVFQFLARAAAPLAGSSVRPFLPLLLGNVRLLRALRLLP
ncbi:MAG: hypothetical protein FD120_2705 [Gammaproteobacteria bacterium]|nr:MAG: hypothetical protein FD120_2705 [Gammaproteobacteria bacterium]